ncbi:MAG TPA: FMN-binding protein [Gemmatimonadales bacterium]|nr:FMN-binding protein [Gemmatimonadales bacterium]
MGRGSRVEGRAPGAGRVAPSAGRFLLAPLTLLALLALPLHAQSRLSQQEALRLAFPAPDSIVRRTAFLSAGDVAKVTTLSGPGVEPPPSVASYYVAWQQGQPVGVAYFDTHRVRTERETLMFVLDRAGTIRRVEVLAFGEPPEYAPPRGWLGQFAGVDSSDGATLKGKIAGITGATLTTRAAERAARRVVALHALVHPLAAAERP